MLIVKFICVLVISLVVTMLCFTDYETEYWLYIFTFHKCSFCNYSASTFVTYNCKNILTEFFLFDIFQVNVLLSQVFPLSRVLYFYPFILTLFSRFLFTVSKFCFFSRAISLLLKIFIVLYPGHLNFRRFFYMSRFICTLVDSWYLDIHLNTNYEFTFSRR